MQSFSFGNGHHFRNTRILQKHKHDVMTIEFRLWYQRYYVKFMPYWVLSSQMSSFDDRFQIKAKHSTMF